MRLALGGNRTFITSKLRLSRLGSCEEARSTTWDCFDPTRKKKAFCAAESCKEFADVSVRDAFIREWHAISGKLFLVFWGQPGLHRWVLGQPELQNEYLSVKKIYIYTHTNTNFWSWENPEKEWMKERKHASLEPYFKAFIAREKYLRGNTIHTLLLWPDNVTDYSRIIWGVWGKWHCGTLNLFSVCLYPLFL